MTANTLQAHLDGWVAHAVAQGSDGTAVAGVTQALRSESERLMEAGLTPDEAFLIALKRVGSHDPALTLHARERAEAMFAGAPTESGSGRAEARVMLACAVAAGLTVKLPDALGWAGEDFYLRNIGLLGMAWLAVYLAWRRPVSRSVLAAVAAIWTVAAVAINTFPFDDAPFGGSAATLVLAGTHLPVLLWLLVGSIATGGAWRSIRERLA